MDARLISYAARSLAALVLGAALFALLGVTGFFAAHPARRAPAGAGPIRYGITRVVPTTTPAPVVTFTSAPADRLVLAVVASTDDAHTVADELAAAETLLVTSGAASPQIVFVIVSEPSVLPALVGCRSDVQLLDLRQGPH